VVLLRDGIDPVLVVEENGWSAILALLQAILKEYGKAGCQEGFGYDGHLQRFEGRRVSRVLCEE
jgi:hypothetical protein